ncbi:hypothetical protein GQ53DRAFT_131017 [Thozetella sp. PMI_491]|nr:hypothetical protein GQ53DRAFT_131017 [Thozetella sp. PMI_491]
MELHHNLTKTGWLQGMTAPRVRGCQLMGEAGCELPQNQMPDLHIPLSWAPLRLTTADGDLFQYFESVALQTLTTCDSDHRRFVGNISRLALTDFSDSSRAVLQALLAIASLHRYGLCAETIKLQSAALRLLKDSAQLGLSDSEAIQHIAAGMLLCSFEIQGDAQISGSWLSYICGAKRLLNVINPKKANPGSELKGMLSWVVYYDVLARFTLRHWHRTTQSADLKQLLGPSSCNLLEIPDISSCSAPLLGPLSEVFENVVPPSHPNYHDTNFRSYLSELEKRLKALRSRPGHFEVADHNPDEAKIDINLELYRLAALIYLERTSKDSSGESPKVHLWAESALELIAKRPACKHVFPLLILGCEARTDDHRIIILDALDQSIKWTHSQSMQSLHKILQAVWNQDDLEARSPMNYVLKMNTLLSSFESMPSFA